MSIPKAYQEAIRQAVDALAGIDLRKRAPALGLPAPGEDGAMSLRGLGRNLILNPEYELMESEGGRPAKPAERILLLHYLACDRPVVEAGNLISFRDFPGGMFYEKAFQARSVKPLVGAIGNDLARLERNLGRFDWERQAQGDFSAKIHAFGNIRMTLVYQVGDDEFGPSADVLFDACVRQALVTEDAAVLASRICLGLL
jgi:hypothetical protein